MTVPTTPDPAVVAAHPDHYPPLASISAGAVDTYAIARGDGRVYGWGINFGGELGFGDGPRPMPSTSPTPVRPAA